MTDTGGTDDLSAAADDLYSAAPEDFVRLRAERMASARSSGDRDLARRLSALRRPTAAAAAVNRHVLTDPTATETLQRIGDRLRAAQGDPDGIDRDLLRELSLERRTVVHDLADRALAAFAPSAGAAVRDEVVATFDAAVADPEIAARLGRLTHAEHWSGLGVVANTPRAALSVVRGPKAGRTGEARQASTKAASPGDRTSSRPDTRTRSQLAAAEKKLSAARSDLDEADGLVASTRARVDELTGELERLTRQLAAAQQEAKAALGAQRAARSRHREAQSTRNRAARRADV